MIFESVPKTSKPFRFRHVSVLEVSLFDICKQQNLDCNLVTPTPRSTATMANIPSTDNSAEYEMRVYYGAGGVPGVQNTQVQVECVCEKSPSQAQIRTHMIVGTTS
jgi:hypothetical protein